MTVERFDMNRTVPPGANNLSQSFCIVLIRLADLLLEGGACMTGIETNDFEPEIAEFVHEPWRHRSASTPMRASSPAARRTKTLICSGTVGHWPRHSLRPALSTTQIAVIFCETSNPTKRVIDEPPTERITGQPSPDRGTTDEADALLDWCEETVKTIGKLRSRYNTRFEFTVP
jgi:hypothetical protein